MSIPSRYVIARLAEYAEILAAYGSESEEARQYFEEYKHLDAFEENARDLKFLEKEDRSSDLDHFISSN